MGNPCNDGKTTTAPEPNLLDEFVHYVGNWAKKSVLEKEKKNVSSFGHKTEVGETEINFLNSKCVIPEQKVGERRHPDCDATMNPGVPSIDWATPRPMGMADHPFVGPDAVIPRTFRFTVETDLSERFTPLIKDLNVNWKLKHINLSIYETMNFDCDEVLSVYSSGKCSRPLTISLYDGCGVKIMAYRFHGVGVHTYSTPFDYASSDPLTTKVVMHYRWVEKLKRPTK